MKKYKGLNAYEQMDALIKECLQQAQLHPYEKYIMIVEQNDVVEQHFFKYTHCLVNIEIMTWQQFLKQLLMIGHLSKHHLASNLELTYILRHIFLSTELSCFHSEHIYPLIQKLIPILKELDLYQLEYQYEQPKLNEIMLIYQKVMESLDDYTHLQLESIFDHEELPLKNAHIYIEANHLYQAKCLSIMEKLDINNELTLFYRYQNDQRLCQMPYHQLCQDAITLDQAHELSQMLYIQPSHKINKDIPVYTYHCANVRSEVEFALHHIYMKIVDEQLHYDDFMIVYPDESYVDILLEGFNALKMPHQLPIITDHQYDLSYQKILKKIPELDDHYFDDIALELLKIDQLDPSYIDYLEKFQDKHEDIEPEEFLTFFKATFPQKSYTYNRLKDVVHVCQIEDVQLAQAKHIYFLGMNETILPRLIKDTNLLLDEDIMILRSKHTQTPPTTIEKLGILQNDILKALMQPALSLTISYALESLQGEALLPSSLYKQLNIMFEPQVLSKPKFQSQESYYLSGGLDINKTELNQQIDQYQKSKNQPQDISSQNILKLYSPHMSISQMETYNKCPFLYFMKYGLKIDPPFEKRLLPNELGSLIHYVLSINIDHDHDIHTLIQDYLSQNDILNQKIKASYMNQYFIEQVEKDLHVTLMILKHQLSLSLFEVKDKEKKVEEDIGPMHFKGFVDRIDEYMDHVCIIDYKSSDKDIDLNLALQGFHIQMLVYLKMITDLQDKKPGAVLYFNTKKRILSQIEITKDIKIDEFYKLYRYGGYVIDDGSHQMIHAIDPQMSRYSSIVKVNYVKSKDTYNGQILTEDQLSVLFDKIEEHMLFLYDEMLKGHIAIEPKGSDQPAIHTKVNPCRYCDYHSVCSFDVFYNEYKLVDMLDVNEILGGEQ